MAYPHDEENRRRREAAETAPRRWTIVGGYDGARHALFVKQDGPWLDPGGAQVEVVPVDEDLERVVRRFLELRIVHTYEEGVDREKIDRSRLKAVVDGEIAGFKRAQDVLRQIAEEEEVTLPPVEFENVQVVGDETPEAKEEP